MAAEGGGPQFGEAEILEISARLGSIPRRLSLTGGSAFETSDNDAVDALLAGRVSRASSLLHRAEAFRLRLAAVAVAVLMAVWVLISYGLPAAANLAARVTPPAIATVIDRGVLHSAEFAVLEPTLLSPERQNSIDAGFDHIASHSTRPGADYTLLFRNSETIGPNAFALPGGTIVVTDQLVALAQSDDELLSVLAHEIAHVEERHGLRQLYRLLGLSAMISLAGGDTGEIIDEVVGQSALLLSLSYSRSFEADADLRAVQLMRAAGRDPQAFAAMLTRLLQGCAGCNTRSWFATHPTVADRVERIREGRSPTSSERHLGERIPQ